MRCALILAPDDVVGRIHHPITVVIARNDRNKFNLPGSAVIDGLASGNVIEGASERAAVGGDEPGARAAAGHIQKLRGRKIQIFAHDQLIGASAAQLDREMRIGGERHVARIRQCADAAAARRKRASLLHGYGS